MTYEYWIALVVGGIVGSFFLLVIVVGVCEKRLIQTFQIPEEGTEYRQSIAAKFANATVEKIGFRHLCTGHHKKGGMYRVRFDFWVSPDHLTFASVCCGSIANIPTEGAWLYSRTDDGRILVTTNEIGEQDISGIEEQQTWAETEMYELLEKHNQRLAGLAIEPFSEESPIAGYFEIRRLKVDALIERGLARYTDEDQTAWRYTLRGSVMFAFTAMLIRPIWRLMRTLRLVRA